MWAIRELITLAFRNFVVILKEYCCVFLGLLLNLEYTMYWRNICQREYFFDNKMNFDAELSDFFSFKFL
jgi:hypothetical protein